MYTVFQANGRPKTNWAGLVVFVRTLKEARAECTQPGEKIVGWTSSGGVRRVWIRRDTGKITPEPSRYSS